MEYIPVSYTHLDVYKRQELCFLSFDFVEKGFKFLQYALIKAYWREIIEFFIRKRLVAPSLVPVSYTHLDVYKRQLYVLLLFLSSPRLKYILQVVRPNHSSAQHDLHVPYYEPVSYTHLR